MSPLPQNQNTNTAGSPPPTQTLKPLANPSVNPPVLQSGTAPLASSSLPTASSSSSPASSDPKKLNQSALIGILVVVSLLVLAAIAFTFWRRSKSSKAKPSSSSGLQRNRPSSSSSSHPEPTSNSAYSSLSHQPNSAGKSKSTRGLLLGSIKEESSSLAGSKEYLSNDDSPGERRSPSSFEEEVRWATPKEEDQGYGNEIRRWDEGEGVVLGTVEYNYGQGQQRGERGGRGGEGRGRGKGRATGVEGGGRGREELPPSFEDARRGGAGRGVYEVLEDRKMLIPERG